jgi:hypothetical protein
MKTKKYKLNLPEVGSVSEQVVTGFTKREAQIIARNERNLDNNS